MKRQRLQLAVLRGRRRRCYGCGHGRGRGCLMDHLQSVRVMRDGFIFTNRPELYRNHDTTIHIQRDKIHFRKEKEEGEEKES